MLSILYIARNSANSKCYIGITSVGLDRRRRGHLTAAKRGTRGRFYDAIRKYGADSFTFSVLETHATFEDAATAERAWIARFKPEYNITQGGEGALGYRHDKATRKAMSLAKIGKPGPWLGKKRSLETVEKIRATKEHRGTVTRHWLGKKRDRATIDKISAAKRGCPAPTPTAEMQKVRVENMRNAAAARCKAVICLSDGEVYKSARAASLAYGFNKGTVAAVCNPNEHNTTSAYGLRFAYLEGK